MLNKEERNQIATIVEDIRLSVVDIKTCDSVSTPSFLPDLKEALEKIWLLINDITIRLNNIERKII